MLKPQTALPGGEYPWPAAYGLGWLLLEHGEGERFVIHNGNNGEYKSFAGFDTRAGDGLVILTNGRNGSDLILTILESM